MTVEIFVTCPECCGEGATEHPPRRQFFDDPYYMEVDCCTACNGVGGWIEEFNAGGGWIPDPGDDRWHLQEASEKGGA